MIQEYLTVKELEELYALKQEMAENPVNISSYEMEHFTELLVKSLQGKGDGVIHLNPTNY